MVEGRHLFLEVLPCLHDLAEDRLFPYLQVVDLPCPFLLVVLDRVGQVLVLLFPCQVEVLNHRHDMEVDLRRVLNLDSYLVVANFP